MYEDFTVVFVEDDEAVRTSIAQTLDLAGLKVLAFERAETALARIGRDLRGIVVSDIQLPGMDGLALFRRVREIDAGIPFVLVTGHGDIDMAVQAMREGAYDFMEKPFSPERLVDVCLHAIEKRGLRLEVDALRRELEGKRGIERALLGDSQVMQNLRRQILNVAGTSADVLLVGETGTGKELAARCLHEHRAGTAGAAGAAGSVAPAGNFVAVNCAGLPETLFESEIFGHEAGAFTGAARRRIGKVEHAHGGTLFLDEIESMPLAHQVKLLRVLQERKVERLGSNAEIPVDFRVVAATKYDLRELSAQGKFRSDLYYRLSVAVIELPALRERREDIPMLFEHFVLLAGLRYGRAAPTVDGGALRALMAADWPGNVRELRNAADRFVLGLDAQPQPLQSAVARAPQTLAQQMDAVEKALVEQALRQHHGRPQPVCDALGIARKTLYDKLHRHGIVIDSFRGGGDDAAPGEPTAQA